MLMPVSRSVTAQKNGRIRHDKGHDLHPTRTTRSTIADVGT